MPLQPQLAEKPAEWLNTNSSSTIIAITSYYLLLLVIPVHLLSNILCILAIMLFHEVKETRRDMTMYCNRIFYL